MDHHLTTDSAERKAVPIATGVLDYFPDALAEVARLSKIGNDKHNPGQPLHWARGKSDDHADCIMRHMIDRGTVDTDGVLHDAKVAWRALAMLQLAIEKQRETPVEVPTLADEALAMFHSGKAVDRSWLDRWMAAIEAPETAAPAPEPTDWTGRRVRCVNDSWVPSVTRGQVYRVVEDDGGSHIAIDVNPTWKFFKDRFELVE